MDLGLSGRTALVAASTDGLGLATARVLVAEGANVWIGGRDPARLAAALESLRAPERDGRRVGRVEGAVLDVTDAASIKAWVAGAAVAYGPAIDALAVNAGGPPPGLFIDLDDDAWRKAFELLVLSAVRTIRESLPGLSARGGSVAVFSSTSVKEPIDGLVLSNSLRSAVVALAKTLSVELAPRGVRVNSLAPGRFATGRVERLDKATAERSGLSADEVRARSQAAIALRRYGEPDEFGRTAAWLLSPASSYLTGQLVTVDGGSLRGSW
ncbi:MAG TPA: SDR family oxidoreductase [Spirochaetales bacterium]|nr:SDR family oxidoreductase [Spirochaetales bacterium]HPM72645.1 SDR family oxidoreductase [Spirochaetales bacterium]